MTTFKQQLESDLDILFNLAEFGETHKIEGVEVVIVIDQDELSKRKQEAPFEIAEATLLFYAKTSSLPSRKGPESSINYDGRECLVVDWNEDYGISEVIIRQNRST